MFAMSENMFALLKSLDKSIDFWHLYQNSGHFRIFDTVLHLNGITVCNNEPEKHLNEKP